MLQALTSGELVIGLLLLAMLVALWGIYREICKISGTSE